MSQEEVLTDLFSDLGHLAAVKRIKLRKLFDAAMMNVEAERGGEE